MKITVKCDCGEEAFLDETTSCAPNGERRFEGSCWCGKTFEAAIVPEEDSVIHEAAEDGDFYDPGF